MSNEPSSKELRRLMTPEMRKKNRESGRRSLLFGIAFAIFLVGEGLWARTHGGTVQYGKINEFVTLPWWAGVGIGGLMAGVCVYVLIRTFTDRD